MSNTKIVGILSDLGKSAKSQRTEIVTICLLLIASAVFFVRATVSHKESVRAPEIVNAQPGTVIGPRFDCEGNPTAPYTLVEFGDYQCPPCHHAFKVLSTQLAQYPNRIRFVFRNLPLSQIHPYSIPAAIIAEEARDEGKFWSVHDRIYELNTLDYAALRTIIKQERLNSKKLAGFETARPGKEISEDITEANKLGIKSTPSFLLCCPDNKVIRLENIQELGRYMN